MQVGLGLFRDFVAATLGVLLILGYLDQELLGGILLVVTTGAAFSTYAYNSWKANKHG